MYISTCLLIYIYYIWPYSENMFTHKLFKVSIFINLQCQPLWHRIKVGNKGSCNYKGFTNLYIPKSIQIQNMRGEIQYVNSFQDFAIQIWDVLLHVNLFS